MGSNILYINVNYHIMMCGGGNMYIQGWNAGSFWQFYIWI